MKNLKTLDDASLFYELREYSAATEAAARKGDPRAAEFDVRAKEIENEIDLRIRDFASRRFAALGE